MEKLLYARAGNQAPYVNPSNDVDAHSTVRGSDFYFAICAVMGASAIVVAALMMRKPRGDRFFHYLSIAILSTACVAYYSMASNLGYAPIGIEFIRGGKVAGRTRQVFYARYIDWFITTPLLLMDILVTAGLPWSTVLFTVFLDWMMIITGLLGALTATRYKWAYYAFGCAAMLFIFYNLLIVGRKSAIALGDDVKKLYMPLLAVNILVWTLYPVAWGLCEGGNVIAADSEAVFYGVLDFIAKPIFTALLLFGHSKIDIGRFGVRGFHQPDLNHLARHSADESVITKESREQGTVA